MKQTTVAAKKKTNLSNIYYDLKRPEGYGGVKPMLAHDKNAKHWLSSQPTYSLHKPMRRRFPTRVYRSGGLNHLWQADLMEMIPYARVNKGYRYVLNVIDVFSRQVHAQPCKSKSGEDVAAALEKIFKQQKPPRFLQTDQGKEFYNAHVKRLLSKHKIRHYSVYSKYKCAIVERFNRTMREKLNRYFTYTGRKVWYNVLQDIVQTYNNKPHRGIYNWKPTDVTRETEMQLWIKKNINTDAKKATRYKIGDYCRISRDRGVFNKNFDQNWSEEVFRIVGIDTRTTPIMYYLQDHNGEDISGKFYKEEIQVISGGPPQIFRIEQVIRSRGTGKHKQYYVKWYGYNEKSWIPASAIVNNG